jgi:hypothetical protein
VNSNANIDATDTLVRLVGKAEGVDATTANNTDAAIALRNVTIVGDGSPDSIGVSAGSLNAHTASVTLDSSIVRGVETSLWRSALAGTANLTALYSDYDPATIVDTGAGALAIGPGNINSDPLFAGASDFHLLAGAPAVDAGNPASFSDTVDLDGQPRVTDGNGDGDARRDMGALERAGIAPPATRPTQPLTTRDHTAPRIARLVVAPSRFAAASGSTTRSGRVARGTHFRFWLSEEADVRIEIQRRLPGSHARYRKLGTLRRHVTAGSRSVRFNGRLGGRALRAGRYRAVLTATDAARNRSGAYRVAFRVVRG